MPIAQCVRAHRFLHIPEKTTPITCSPVYAGSLVIPCNITDAEWAVLSLFASAERGVGLPRSWPLRLLVNALLTSYARAVPRALCPAVSTMANGDPTLRQMGGRLHRVWQCMREALRCAVGL